MTEQPHSHWTRRGLGLARPRVRIALAAVVCLALPWHARSAAPPPRSVEAMYLDAGAKEQAVRTALSDPSVTPAAVKAVRTVVADYEELVRQYPASAYCDDALWRAARLSLDAHRTFGEAHDQAAGVRLLRALASRYPSSRYAKQAPAVIAAESAADPRRLPQAGTSGATTATPAARTVPPPAPAPRPVGAEPALPSRLVTIKAIRRIVLPDAIRIVIELDGEVPTFHDERLANPLRVFVDLASTRAAPELVDRTIRFETDADAVRQVRLGRHPNTTTRVVLDAAGISSYSVYPLYSPYRLVIDCLRETITVPLLEGRRIATSFAPRLPPALSPPPLKVEDPSPAPHVTASAAPRGTQRAAPPVTGPGAPPVPSVPSVATTTPAPVIPVTPPARNMAGGFSMARQLGLGVSRIVIDPGHGGQDPGAVGRGITEASLVLDVALRLEKLLAKVPEVEVILTRRTDEYLPLHERTAIANREGADLFLSIHANASNNTRASGVETYFLNFATNASAAAIAARENAASGQAMGALPDYVKAIALTNKLAESRDFATFVQRAMIQRLTPANKDVKDLGVRQAPFVVLIGAAMPSVLAEISFVTNAQEAKLLRGTAYRQRIAEALFEAIRKYQGSLKTVGNVATQQ
jgi:N-acetylmuramoyl-L-alanine amidase